MLASAFQACFVEPFKESIRSRDGKWKIDAFYLDSSGRSIVSLPLRLKFASLADLNAFLEAKCIHPEPQINAEGIEKNVLEDADNKEANGVPKKNLVAIEQERLVTVEARVTLTVGNAHAALARVEGVTIVSTRVETETSSLVLATEIVVRVSRTTDDARHMMQTIEDVKATLEMTAAFIESESNDKNNDNALQLLQSFNQGGEPLQTTQITRLPPFHVQVILTHALSIAIRTIPGPEMGQTFLALQMKHSNTHSQPVTIKSIELHPGVSILQHPDAVTLAGSSTLPQTLTVTADMTKVVKWTFSQADPKLPLVLQPNEGYSAVLTVVAKEDLLARQCTCPLSISAFVHGSSRHEIVAAVDASFHTARSAVEPSDALAIRMLVETLSSDTVKVGAPFSLALEVSNLSFESRQIMVMIDQEASLASKWAIVSEVQGQKFGISGPETGQDLLAVDAALVLGEIKGNSSIKASLRLIPLRTGTLSIPNFRIVDSRSGKRYYCAHKLQAVATAS